MLFKEVFVMTSAFSWQNSIRYADDTTLLAESEEELKSLLMKVKVRMKKLA